MTNPFDPSNQQAPENNVTAVTGELVTNNDQPTRFEEITPLIRVVGDKQAIQLSAQFLEGLKPIRATVDRARELLNVDIATIEEDELKEIQDELANGQKLASHIRESRQKTSQFFDSIKKTNLEFLDAELERFGYNELVEADRDTKKLKKDVSAHRINTRWEELRPTFESNVTQFENILRLAPELGDYSRFRVRHPKLITGAKAFKVSDKIRGIVNEEMFRIHTELKRIEENPSELTPHYQGELLKDYKQDPQTTHLYAREDYYKNRLKADIEASERRLALQEKQRQEQEAAEAARLKALEAQGVGVEDVKKAAPTVQPVQSVQAPVTPLPPRQENPALQGQTMYSQNDPFAQKAPVEDKFAWLAEYIFNDASLRDISTNKQTKVRLLHTMYVSFNNRNSIFSQKTAMKPEAVIELTEYILSL